MTGQEMKPQDYKFTLKLRKKAYKPTKDALRRQRKTYSELWVRRCVSAGRRRTGYREK
jgi:hypothetical protein